MPKPVPDWSWVGTEINSPADITHAHIYRAAGLHSLTPCSRSDIVCLPSGDWGLETTDPDKKHAKECKLNPKCYANLGINAVHNADGREAFMRRCGEEPGQRSGPIGLKNHGATCYVNAFLEVWYHNLALRNALYKCPVVKDSCISLLVNVFAFLQESRRDRYDPVSFLDALRIDKTRQEDSSEWVDGVFSLSTLTTSQQSLAEPFQRFAQLVMQAIHEELGKQSGDVDKRLVSQMFSGQKQYETKCQGCGRVSRREEEFWTLQLSLKDGETLDQRLSEYIKDEYLFGDNQYQCGGCGKRCNAVRSVNLHSLPVIVNFSLMRFKYNHAKGNREKVKHAILYPRSTSFGGVSYDLKGVVYHLGPSAQRGHYVTEVYNDLTGKWYECDDETVTEIQSDESAGPPKKKARASHPDHESSRDAYALVYARRLATPAQTSHPPDEAMAAVEADNEALNQEVQAWRDRRHQAQDEFEELKGIKMPVIRALSGTDRAVPRLELARWIAADKSGIRDPLSYEKVACEHCTPVAPKINPRLVGYTRLISQISFDLIATTSGSIAADICEVCVSDICANRLSRSNRVDQVKIYNELNSGPASIVLPRNWIKDWKDDREDDHLPTDNGYSLFCDHDEPFYDSKAFQLVTPEALAVLQSAVGPFKSFDKDAAQCGQCTTSREGTKVVESVWKDDVKRDRKLAQMTKPTPIYDTEHYYVLSPAFVKEWEEFRREPRPRPEYKSDICKHGGVPFDPSQDNVTVVPMEGWLLLQKLYGRQHDPVYLRYTSRPKANARTEMVLVSPQTCASCRKDRLLEWEETEVCVSLGKGQPTGTRRSRSTTERYIKVTKDTTIKELRVTIMNLTKISPLSQELTYEGKKLERAEHTMRDVGMFKGGLIRCEEIIEVDEEDDAPEGFYGTALIGDGSTPVQAFQIACTNCTLLNDANSSRCEACDAPMPS